MKSIGIIGGGFGLYGYLPAAISCGLKVITCLKYLKLFDQRDDIDQFIDQIEFKNKEETIIKEADILVIARRPEDQEKILNNITPGKLLIIEKPIARTPKVAGAIINKLAKECVDYRIGFTFLETSWYDELRSFYTANKANINYLEINWSFQAHHYEMELINWKRNINEGGGAFKFYGCHILSLLAGIDKWDINGIDSFCYNENDEYMFKLELQNLKGVKCSASCNSDSLSEPVFEINIVTNTQNQYNYKSKDPFDYLINSDNLFDYRMPLLESIINSFSDNTITYTILYEKYIALWKQSEFKRIVHTVS